MTRLQFDIPLGIVLSLALILTGSAGALARTLPPGVAAMVICADGSAATVLVDQSGQPVEPSSLHDCRSCSFCGPHADGLQAVSALLTAPHRIVRSLSPKIQESLHTGLNRPWRRARGPPKEH